MDGDTRARLCAAIEALADALPGSSDWTSDWLKQRATAVATGDLLTQAQAVTELKEKLSAIAPTIGVFLGSARNKRDEALDRIATAPRGYAGDATGSAVWAALGIRADHRAAERLRDLAAILAKL